MVSSIIIYYLFTIIILAVTENTAFQTALVCSVHKRFFTTMRYVNQHFTYLLTYLFT